MNITIYEDLRTHLFIEYFSSKTMFLNEEFGITKKQLFEQYGVFDGCDDIARKIIKTLETYPDSNSVFVPIGNSFIDSVYAERKDADGIKTAAYLPTISTFRKDENNKERFSQVTIYIKKNANKHELFGSIMHELTHAYQDICMKNNGLSMTDKLKDFGYHLNDINKHSDWRDTSVSHLLYFFNKFESGAYIAQIDGELKGSGKVFDTVNDVMDFIRGTTVYRNYELMFSHVDYIRNVENTEDRKMILKYANERSNNSFKTFDDFIRWILVRCKDTKRKFKEALPKIAHKNLKVFEIFSPNPDVLLESINNKIVEK